MAAGSRTFTLEESFLEPQAIDPPPTRHALLILLLILAALLHLGTAGWGELYNGAEGRLAGAAREMLETRQWFLPTNDGVPLLQTPPLAHWLIIFSYELFGVSPMAARLPGAIATIASIGLTFFIGEQLAGYWRGFAAALIYLCSAGTFLLGRSVTPAPIFSAFIAGAVFCLICGYQRRRFRRAWFAGFWLCTSFGCLTSGLTALFYLAALCALLAFFFREARVRFPLLLHWSYLLVFILMVGPWFVWAGWHFRGFFPYSLGWLSQDGVPRWRFFILHLVWWFPALLLVLPGLLFAARKIIRPHDIGFADALPLCWIAVGLILPLLLGERTAASSMSMWPAFALWAACAWERTPPPLRFAAISALILVGAIGGIVSLLPENFAHLLTENIPFATLLALRPLLQIASIALLIFAALALYFAAQSHPEIALVVVLSSMIPIGLCLAEGTIRIAPFFSFAAAADFLNRHADKDRRVLYEGPLDTASSLTFYLNQKFFLVNQQPARFEQNAEAEEKYLDENYVLQAWNRADPIYLIVPQSRTAHWEKLVTVQVHIYHQVTTCGHYVVLSNEL
ncbi:MAG TPA: glycosyltransferase family 39 protein [Chthoniobacterales bacterium]|jgi:4-amino-4-deoxy-L-arabinose transferase-like glycosyltransferase